MPSLLLDFAQVQEFVSFLGGKGKARRVSSGRDIGLTRNPKRTWSSLKEVR